ncbi:hypothetical protein D3C80_1685910 [compost metagenome]
MAVVVERLHVGDFDHDVAAGHDIDAAAELALGLDRAVACDAHGAGDGVDPDAVGVVPLGRDVLDVDVEGAVVGGCCDSVGV